MVTLYFTFCATGQLFFKVTTLFHVLSSSVCGFQFLHIFTNIFIFCHFDYSHSSGCEVLSHFSFDLYFPND